MMSNMHYKVETEVISRKRRREKLNRDIRWILKLFMSMDQYLFSRKKLTMVHFKQIKEMSAVLSNLLPKITNASLTEIDDLIYPNDNLSNNGNNSKLLCKQLIERKFNRFQTFYQLVTAYRVTGFPTKLNQESFQIMDTAYIKMIENIENNFNVHKLMQNILELATSRKYLCHAIKLLKAVLDRGPECVKELTHFKTYTGLFMWFSKLKDFPEGRDPQTKRITSFLRHQSNEIFSKIKLDCDPTLKSIIAGNKKLQNRKTLNESFIKLLNEVPVSFMQVDHLYRYFSSAQNDEEKLQRKRDFLRGSLMISENLAIWKGIEDYFYNHECRYPYAVMKQIDKYHCNDLEPFITVNDSNDANVDSLNYDGKEQPDLTFERFFYDGFLKGLYVQSNIYDACMSCMDLIGVKMNFEGQLRSAKVNRKLRYKLRDPLAKAPWWLDTLLKKCPFLVVPKSHEHMLDDIFRMMRGEILDDSTWESLNFILNSGTIKT